MSQEGKKFDRKQFAFNGEWDPTNEPIAIGEENYSVLDNYRYRKQGGLEAVQGYSKINLNPIGMSWITRTSSQDNSWRSICWSPELNLFCAVAIDGTNRVMTSPDGITWTNRTAAAVSDWQAVCWSPELGLFCAVASVGTTRVMTSVDGTTWLPQTASSSNSFNSICWSPEETLFVATSMDGDNRVMTSPDGAAWTNRTPPLDEWRGVCWSPGLSLFVAVGSGTTYYVMTSPDGFTWTGGTAAQENHWYSVCWSPELERLCAVAYTGTNRIMTSPDGFTWTAQIDPNDNGYISVVWSAEAGVFVAVTYVGTDDRIMASVDGIRWFTIASPVDNNWTSVCWSPELDIFCAVSATGTDDRVMTSPASDASAYFKGRSGIQLISPHTQKTRVLVQAFNANEDGSAVIENLTSIPDQGDFEGAALNVDIEGAGLGRFSKWPGGSIAYCNGKESKVYAGDEKECDAFITSTAEIDHEVTDALDYTEPVKNTLDGPEDIAIVGGGVDSFTKLLLHCDGDDESTSFDDDGDTGHTPVAQNTAQLDTDQSKFGPSAGLFDGNSDYVIVPDHDDWYMAAGNFTIDFWVRFASLPSNGDKQGLFQQYEDSDNYAVCYTDITRVGEFTFRHLSFEIKDGGVETLIGPFWVNLTTNTWTHIAVIRGWGEDDNKWTITVDGSGLFGAPEASSSDDWPNFTASDFEIGRATSGGDQYLHGWIDEFRVSKGVARWTSSFTPPVKAYGTSALNWLIGSTRPLKGCKLYISSPNTHPTTSTLTVKEWNGNGWSLLEINDGTKTELGGGKSLKHTGSVTWPHTYDSSKVKLLEKRLLYWYQFELTAGTAEIYHATVDAGWQDIRDLWDGILRVVGQFRFEHTSFVYDATLDVNVETPSGVAAADSYTADLGGLTTSEWVDIGLEERTCALYVKMFEGESGHVNSVSATILAVEYWTGEGWKLASGLFDGTSDVATSATLAKSGYVTWDPPEPSEEAIRNEYGHRLYYYRLSVSGFALSSSVLIDMVQGIPAPADPRPVHRFPFMFRSRPMLCGAIGRKEGGRVDFGITGSTEGFNGFDSSFGLSPLYFGGSEDLTCACELYNRFVSNIYAMGVFCKDNETYLLTGYDADTYTIRRISGTVGCPAPLTMDTVEINYGIGGEAIIRNVAGWLSYNGPYLFDGGVLEPITNNIYCYFDKSDLRCINFDAIENCRAWMDPDNFEFNLGLCSGSGQTEINVWVCYDLVLKRWFKKIPELSGGGTDAFPQMAFRVADENGAQYVYGMRKNGYLMQLENGPDWDGINIEQKVTFGDQIPTKNIWDYVTTRYFRLITESISEAATININHYKNGENSPTPLRTIAANGPNRYVRDTQRYESKGFSHQFEIETSTLTTKKGVPLLAWGYQYERVREDL